MVNTDYISDKIAEFTKIAGDSADPMKAIVRLSKLINDIYEKGIFDGQIKYKEVEKCN
jgi:hypothetical protein